MSVNTGPTSLGAGSTLTFDIQQSGQLTLYQPASGPGFGSETTINFQHPLQSSSSIPRLLGNLPPQNLSPGFNPLAGIGVKNAVFTFVPNANSPMTSMPTVTGFNGSTDEFQVVGATSASLTNGILTFTLPPSGTVLETVSFNIVGPASNAPFNFDVATGGVIFNFVPCFLRGAHVVTPTGAIPIENLNVGDKVVALHQGDASIKWIGRRVLGPRPIHSGAAILPIRVRKDALADGSPYRDLFLSPDHSLFLGGVLIPVKLLVNGTTIVQEQRDTPFEYLHIELEQHDVILVDGAMAETYLDLGNRSAFERSDNSSFQKKAKARDWRAYCYPPVYEGTIFEKVRTTLAVRARRLGYGPPLGLVA